VMRGYRADEFSQIETLVFMALYERAHAVYLRNLEAKITEPVLKGLVGRIAADEERHEQFFHNLVAHCVETHRESTIAAIGRRGSSLGLVGGDIIEYQDKLKAVADAGIFDLDASRKVVSDRIKAWGLDDVAVLKKFVCE
jgi:acyl-[acyl-carrier-protein] desaturase